MRTIPHRHNLTVVLVGLYRYLNFPVRIMHSLLENIDGVTPHTIFYKNYETNLFSPPTKQEEDLFVKLITELKPDLIGFSVLSPYVSIAKRLTEICRKNSSSFIIWGGIHPTISPDESIKDADIICVGEGEEALKELVVHLRDGTDFSSTKNLWINTGRDIIQNPMRPLVQDLDSLPFPSYGRDSFYFIEKNTLKRQDQTLRDKQVWIQSSRGCPYKCAYCVNSLLHPLFSDLGPYTRRRSVASIIKEVEEQLQLSHKSKNYVYFVDEVFGNNKVWLDQFVQSYKEKIALPFFVEYNPKMLNASMLDRLVSAGIDTINIGVQSCSDHIRNTIFHRPGTNSNIVSLAQQIHERGIKIQYDLILDNPYETEQTLTEGIQLLLQLPKPLSFHLFSLQYFPGYPFTQKAIEDGYAKPEETTIDSLLERTTLKWAFVPKGGSKNKKQLLQNIIWLIAWGHVNNRIVSYAVFHKSFLAKLCLRYLDRKAIIWGNFFGLGGVLSKSLWLQRFISGIRLITQGDFRSFVTRFKQIALQR